MPCVSVILLLVVVYLGIFALFTDVLVYQVRILLLMSTNEIVIMIYSIGCITIEIGRPLLAERFVLSGFPIVHCMFISVYVVCDYVIMFSSVSNKAFIY